MQQTASSCRRQASGFTGLGTKALQWRGTAWLPPVDHTMLQEKRHVTCMTSSAITHYILTCTTQPEQCCQCSAPAPQFPGSQTSMPQCCTAQQGPQLGSGSKQAGAARRLAVPSFQTAQHAAGQTHSAGNMRIPNRGAGRVTLPPHNRDTLCNSGGLTGNAVPTASQIACRLIQSGRLTMQARYCSATIVPAATHKNMSGWWLGAVHESYRQF